MNSPRNKIAISRLHWPVTTLGYGKRIGIWFQGCSVHCKDCCSQDTWETHESSITTIDSVINWVKSRPIAEIDGITISGGEPFDQPIALELLINRLRRIFEKKQVNESDFLIYSGYPWKLLLKNHQSLVKQFDAIVSEPYQHRKTEAWLRGSDNQKIRCLSRIGKTRYENNPPLQSKNIQIGFDGEKVWMIGIPQQGDLEKLESRLKIAGINLGDVSWRS